ncbi:TRAPP subunit [Sorochytrium milnesiophthora]
MSYYLAVVGTQDNPVYEAEFGNVIRKDDLKHLDQFIAHASLDVIEDMMFLKTVDKFNEWFVSGYITPSSIKLVLLHDTKNDDGIKNFLGELHELYIKTLMNPFYDVNKPIHSTAFDEKVRAIAKRYL